MCRLCHLNTETQKHKQTIGRKLCNTCPLLMWTTTYTTSWSNSPSVQTNWRSSAAIFNFLPLIEIVVHLSRLLGAVGTGTGGEQTTLRPDPLFGFFPTPSISAVVLLVRNRLRFCDIFVWIFQLHEGFRGNTDKAFESAAALNHSVHTAREQGSCAEI